MSILYQLQKHIEAFRNQKVRLKLIYDTSKHTLSADDFHQHCDNQGPTLTVLYGIHNVMFGGYTKQTWDSVSGSKTDKEAFIFTTKGGQLQVYEIRDGSEKYAIYCSNEHGPFFGRTLISGGFLTFHDGPITTSGCGIYKLNGNIKNLASFGKKSESNSRREFNGGSMDVNRLEVYEVCEELIDAWLRIEHTSDELRQSLQGQATPGLEGMPFNILLVGQISSGKSSFINTALSAMNNVIKHSAIVSDSVHSETNKNFNHKKAIRSRDCKVVYVSDTIKTGVSIGYYKYDSMEQSNSTQLRLTDTILSENPPRYDLTAESLANDKKVFLFDVRGIEQCRGMTYELEQIIQGQLRLGYEFPDLDIPCDGASNVKEKNCGRINIVCFVIDSTTHSIMSEKTLAYIEEMKRIASKLEVQRVVVVTKLDNAYHNIKDNHEHMFKSTNAMVDVERIANDFGLSQKHVYPVLNYTSQKETDELSNQLVLHALTSMVKLAEDQELSKLGGTNEKENWLNRDRSADYKSEVGKMKKCMSDLMQNLVGNSVRILMVGSIDSGKSSFINSLCSTLIGRFIKRVNFTSGGEKGKSKTKEYRAYQLKVKLANGKEEKLPIRVCDIPGLACPAGLQETTTTFKTTDIVNIVEGRLKSGHKFTEVNNQECAENSKQPKIVHGICFVLSMTDCRDEKATSQIKHVIERLETIPHLIILTKIDQYCNSIDTIYQNPAVAEAAIAICAKIPAVKLSDIYPVKNYTHEAFIDDSLDMLILDAFSTLLFRSRDYIDSLQDDDDDDDELK